MDEAHKELVKRLRGGRCPQCFGFGEVSYAGELVRCSCRDKYEAPISMEHRKAAALALEALAGEVAALKGDAGPATQPAPAVCVWTGEEYVTYSTSCESEHDVDPHKAPPTYCPSCGKPIKFTEANHG